jgi:hypothetical protein
MIADVQLFMTFKNMHTNGTSKICTTNWSTLFDRNCAVLDHPIKGRNPTGRVIVNTLRCVSASMMPRHGHVAICELPRLLVCSTTIIRVR